MLPKFPITSTKTVSTRFKNLGIDSFEAACDYICRLPYGRNANKLDPTTVFTDGRGTCSTKHALLKLLADENGRPDIKLYTGIFRMQQNNTPQIGVVLNKYNMAYMPEAHCYLKYNNGVYDFTSPAALAKSFLRDLVEEIEITPQQITDHKIAYHQKYLNRWLAETDIPYTFQEVWIIREECIAQLSK